jgi:REP element-mobilizing transposase RayT
MTPDEHPKRRKSYRSVVPYNPELRRLVEAKSEWQHGPNEPPPPHGFRGWHQRGYLPHRDEPGLTQFVTFRLHDAFPVALRSEWAALLEIEDNRQRQRRLEAYLDLGRGASFLRQPRLATMTENALRYFHGVRYELLAWAVMPNHVHVLFKSITAPMCQILQSWKSFTSKTANRALGRAGSFWEEDYWDTYARTEEQEGRMRRYIENNPVKANLAREATKWEWSSARFRDSYGRLNVPQESEPGGEIERRGQIEL